MIASVPVLVLLFLATAKDIEKREIPNWIVDLMFLYSALLYIFTKDFTGVKVGAIIGLLVFISHLIPALFLPDSIGGGDIKLISVLAFHLKEKFFVLIIFLFFMLLGVLIYSISEKKGLRLSVPMAPYIFTSALFTILVDIIVNSIV